MTLREEIERRRTFAIIAHPDAGKTTLTEKLLLFGGAIQPFEELSSQQNGESSAVIRERVLRVRALQAARYKDFPKIRCNADLPAGKLQQFCPLEPTAEAILRSAMTELGLTARAYTRILRVARTIADMAGSDIIQQPHLFEAIQYRSLDRTLW